MASDSDLPRARIDALAPHAGKRVRLQGWLYHRRSSKSLHFLQVRDGSGIVQCVTALADVGAETFETAGKIGQESSLEVTGTVRADARAPGGFELNVDGLAVLQDVPDYPIAPKDHGVAFLLERRHLWLRSRRPHAILRIRARAQRAACEYLDAQGYLRVDTPILTPAACEGSTTLFETPYFEEKAFLAQSGQLYSEASAAAFGRVYCFGPTFRAEKSKTRRHLMEFWMLEPEAAFLDHEGNIGLAEGVICAIVQAVLEHCRPELEVLERNVAPLEAIQRPVPRMTYEQAVAHLQQSGLNVQFGDDFGGDEETALASKYDRPLVIERYPTSLKPFYMKPDPTNPKVVLNMDVIAPEGYGEIVGGSTREDDLAALESHMREKGIDPTPLDWYRELRQFGSVPHSGFGLGLERTLAWICGVHHLRETIAFPRLMGRLHP
jgi:asparaginyl-tRNA synthetase